MRQALRQKSAADSARVQFGVIENSDLSESAPSAEDDGSAADYKASVWYFRRDLRASANVHQAVAMALTISRETEMLREWAGWHGVLPEVNVHVSAGILRDAIRLTTSHMQAIKFGLFLCHELEQLKAQACAAGLVPPKCVVARAEAEEKGWAAHQEAS
jgi:hypothetical protein